jgi:hypothetical protein
MVFMVYPPFFTGVPTFSVDYEYGFQSIGVCEKRDDAL